jgi:hypothetical protein
MLIHGTSENTLSDLTNRIGWKAIIIPDHQREDVWDEAKKKSWSRKIKTNNYVSGMITIYQLKGQENKDVWYINDGVQRLIYGVAHFKNEMRAGGFTEDQINQMLSRVNVAVQRVEYDHLEEAISEFIVLNATGTVCTPYELTKGIFVSRLKDYDVVWKPIFQHLHDLMQIVLSRMGCSSENTNKKKKRDTYHKRLRDDYSLFYHFISKDQTRTAKYKVAAATLDTNNWDQSTALENNLVKELNKKGPQKVKELIYEFEQFLNTRAALYEQKWLLSQSKLKAPSNVHFRWWLLLSILTRNWNTPPAVFAEFTEKLIKTTSGKTALYYADENKIPCNCNTALSNMGNFNLVLKILKMKKDDFNAPDREKDKRNARPGYHDSHENAFSQFGNGPTLLENGFENKARGNRDMTVDEKKELELVND